MKNMETWKFAHDYCGRLWWRLGLITLVPTALLHIPFYHSDVKTIGIFAVCLLTDGAVWNPDRIDFPDRTCLEEAF